MKKLALLVLTIVLMSCNESPKFLQKGMYRATLKVNDTLNLPFVFEVTSPSTLKIFNADEVIKVDEIQYKNDSVYIKLPVFEGFLVAKILKSKTLRALLLKKH